MNLVSTLSHSPATTDGGWGLEEMVCIPVLSLSNSYILMNCIILRLDKRLLIWDLWQEDIEKPVHTFLGANVRGFWLQATTTN